jgi:hypothetical protein
VDVDGNMTEVMLEVLPQAEAQCLTKLSCLQIIRSPHLHPALIPESIKSTLH